MPDLGSLRYRQFGGLQRRAQAVGDSPYHDARGNTGVTCTQSEREKIYAEEECRQAERERALRDIIRIMRCHDITADELERLLRNAKTLTNTDYLSFD